MSQTYHNNYEFLAHVRVKRTRTATFFEAVCGLLVIAMWVLSFLLGSGSVGEMVTNTIVNALLTGLIVALLWVAYRPSLFNIPVPITNGRQVATAVRLVHVVTLETSVYFALLPVLVACAWGAVAILAETVVLIVMLAATIVYYCRKISREQLAVRTRKTNK